MDASEGDVYAYLGSIGEQSYQDNGISGIPLNQDNAQWSQFVNETSAEVRINMEDTDVVPTFCYSCWYYLTILAN